MTRHRRTAGVGLVIDDLSRGRKVVLWYPPQALSELISGESALTEKVFGGLFRPKQALCNQPFQLRVDDICFLTLPVLVGEPEATQRIPLWLESTKGNAAPAAAQAGAGVGAAGSGSGSGSGSGGGSGGGGSGGSGGGGSGDLVFFALIFAFREEGAEDELGLANEVLLKMSTELLREERRVGYVSKETVKLLAVREMFAKGGFNRAVGAEEVRGDEEPTKLAAHEGMDRSVSPKPAGEDAGPGSDAAAAAISADHAEDFRDWSAPDLMELMMERSVLANELREVYHRVRSRGRSPFALRVNGRSAVFITESFPPRFLADSLREGQALLLLMPEQQILARLPPDATDILAVVVKAAASPELSFRDVSRRLRMSAQRIFWAAGHLVRWGLATVIERVTQDTAFCISPGVDLAHLEDEEALFALAFPGLRADLRAVLALFDPDRSLGRVLELAKDEIAAEGEGAADEAPGLAQTGAWGEMGDRQGEGFELYGSGDSSDSGDSGDSSYGMPFDELPARGAVAGAFESVEDIVPLLVWLMRHGLLVPLRECVMFSCGAKMALMGIGGMSDASVASGESYTGGDWTIGSIPSPVSEVPVAALTETGLPIAPTQLRDALSAGGDWQKLLSKRAEDVLAMRGEPEVLGDLVRVLECLDGLDVERSLQEVSEEAGLAPERVREVCGRAPEVLDIALRLPDMSASHFSQ